MKKSIKISILRRFDQLDRIFGKAEIIFSSFLLVMMVLVVGLGVFLRYIMRSPLIAGVNFSTLMLVWLTFFGGSTIYRQKGHIAIEFVMDHFPDSFRKVATVVVYIIIAVSLIIVVIQTFCLMILQWDQEIVALGIPRSFLSLPLFIAAILMFFTTIHHLLAESTEHQRRE